MCLIFFYVVADWKSDIYNFTKEISNIHLILICLLNLSLAYLGKQVDRLL